MAQKIKDGTELLVIIPSLMRFFTALNDHEAAEVHAPGIGDVSVVVDSIHFEKRTTEWTHRVRGTLFDTRQPFVLFYHADNQNGRMVFRAKKSR